MINELDYYRRGYGRSNQRSLLLGKRDRDRDRDRDVEGSYFRLILETAGPINGVPCFKCRTMIEPGTDCMAKYRNNNLVPITKHYHMGCYEALYH